jgi:very-short-patch-repair endonuclease
MLPGVTVRSTRSPARGWLRSREWERITRGVYAASLSRTQFEELAAWHLVLPRTAAFSHLTAARLRGWWLPATIAHPVFAAMLNADPRPRRPGLLVCRHTQPFPMNLVGGLRITTAAETILAAARDLGVLDLVILGDSALRLRHCTLTDLEITARQRRRGAPLLRKVIPLLDARSESAWESIMRVLHQAAEIPVTPQHEIFDEDGRFIARADLRINGTRRIHEYDGARHREADVHEDDLERDRALLAARWERHGFTSKHLRRDGATIIADADRLLGRAWNPRRLAAWQGLLDHSLLGRAGRARAYRNWRRATAETGQMQQDEGGNLGGT